MNKETLRMQKLAGIITESQYKQLLEDMEVVNKILDKISIQGKDSLSSEENEYLDRYSRGETDLSEPSNDVEEEPIIPSNLKMVKDDYNSRKDELKAMGKERNKYSQLFAKWAKTQIKDINFGSGLNNKLNQLFGLFPYSMYPKPNGRTKNFLPIETLEEWKSNNDPKYIGLLVYVGRIIDPEPRKY